MINTEEEPYPSGSSRLLRALLLSSPWPLLSFLHHSEKCTFVKISSRWKKEDKDRKGMEIYTDCHSAAGMINVHGSGNVLARQEALSGDPSQISIRNIGDLS